ncbi:MAG: pseudouridine synthase [Bacillota bacterium]
MAKERLDKVLGHMGVGSRKELKGMIKAGRVLVDGQVARDPGISVDPAAVQIAVDGQVLAYQKHFWVLLHKPGGVITATDDPRQRTVLDVLPPELKHRELFPVGRLDKDTEGLLLLTTDGELGHRLLSPRWHVPKRYLARVDGPLSPADAEAFAAGVELEDGYVTMPGRLEITGPQEGIVTIHEGKYHQVKRMFEARGRRVLYLKRLSMGPLTLGDLPYGQARPLTAAEVAALYDSAGLPRP